jgi:hypothetical protein
VRETGHLAGTRKTRVILNAGWVLGVAAAGRNRAGVEAAILEMVEACKHYGPEGK